MFYRTEDNQALEAKMATSLLAPTAFAFASDLLAKYEAGSAGLRWSMLWDDDYPLGAMMAMLVVDGILYFSLAAAIQLLPLMPRQRCVKTPTCSLHLHRPVGTTIIANIQVRQSAIVSADDDVIPHGCSTVMVQSKQST